MTERIELVPVAEGNPYPLGRHVRHDERSKAYPPEMAATWTTTYWAHKGAVLNQGSLGSCTGNALVDALMSGPLYRHGRDLVEADAVRAYSLATQLDPFPGTYPPTDTGSDGLDVCKAGVQLGWLKGYTHAFGLDQCLRALALGPVIIGINWYQDMFTPAANGMLSITGSLAGGHEVALTALTTSGLVRVLNSWGPGWGVNGTAWLRIADLGTLLSQQGDCTIPVSV